MDRIIDVLENARDSLSVLVAEFERLNDAMQGLHLLIGFAMKDPALHEYLDGDHVVSLSEVIDERSLGLTVRLEQLAAEFDAVPEDVSTNNVEAFRARLAALRQHGAIFTERFNRALTQLSTMVGIDEPF